MKSEKTTTETVETTETTKRPADGTNFETIVKVCDGKKKLNYYIYKIESTEKTPAFYYVNATEEIFTELAKAQNALKKAVKKKAAEIYKELIED